ncbi:MAG: peptidylprolyl isomerase [Trueperaceae bacterium]
MTGRLALIAAVAALLLVGVWATFGERWTLPAGSAASEGAPPTDAPSDAPDVPHDHDVPDGFAPVAFLTDEPVRAFDGPEPVLDDGRDYLAQIETTAGTIVVDLYQDRTPVTVNNFVFLALHHYYEGVPFHRVIEEFMAQTGDPTGTGTGGPGYDFDDEIVSDLTHDRPGLLSMANAGPGTNGSQFFFTFGATPWLDGAHTIFGEIVDGLEVLDAIERVDPQNPSVVALLSDPPSVLQDQGVDLDAYGGQAADDVTDEARPATVEAWLARQLDELPDLGATFRLNGRRGVIGSVDGATAVGLFGVPDRIDRVTVLVRDPDRANDDPAAPPDAASTDEETE